MTTETQFYRTYENLAADGHCDCAGGAEYRRVYSEWIAAGRPEPHAAFIRTRASCVPDELLEAEKYMAQHVDPIIDEVIAEAVDEAERDDAGREDS